MKFTAAITLSLIILIIGLAGCIDRQIPEPILIPVEGDTYTDPNGLFTVPIPTNWTAAHAENGGYGVLSSPDSDLEVYIMAVEAASVEEGVKAAWGIIDPTFDLDPAEVMETPAQNGTDIAITIVYDTGNEDQVVLAGGWHYEDIAYIELIRGGLETIQKRVSQVSIIDSGYTIAALAPTNLGNTEPLPIDEQLLVELEEYILDVMERFDVPGLSIAIVRDGSIIYSEGFGVREMGKDEPVTPETMMLIGSTTKTMTTMLMAKLVDSELMDWDTRVIDILPSFAVADPGITQNITMQNMVCACTGVPRRDLELIFNADNLGAESIIESLADFEFFTEFGEAFQYSNQMVGAGGYLATLAAGGTYGNLYDDYTALMKTDIFDPIGMNDTTFSFDDARSTSNFAIPHTFNAVLEYSPIPLDLEDAFLLPIAPAGGAWSNAMDMGRYLITELNQGITPTGERVVSTSNLAKTWEPQVAMTNTISYGLGWIVGEYKGVSVLEHGGNTLGFTSELAFLPDEGIGISILTNQRASFANQMIRMRFMELLYDQEPEFDELVESQWGMIQESITELRETIEPNVDPDPVESYIGRYTNPVLGEIAIEWRNNMLIFDAGEFLGEVRSRVDENGDTSYFLYDSVLQGLGIYPDEDEEGSLTLTIGSGIVEYIFVKVE